MMPSGSDGASGPLGMILTPWVKRLMVATAVLSIVGALSRAWMGANTPTLFLFQPAALWGQGVALPGIFALWQPLTYPFFLTDPLSLLFSLAAFGWFAGAMEARWGGRRFLVFWGLTSALPALLVVPLALAWPALAQTFTAGPWPFLEGLIIAWGLTFPKREIRLAFVLPVQGQMMVWLGVGIIALQIIFAGTFAPFMVAIFAMAIAALVVTGAWRPRRLGLYLRQLWLGVQLKVERRRRKGRVSKSHLHTVDPKDEGGGPGGGPWLN